MHKVEEYYDLKRLIKACKLIIAHLVALDNILVRFAVIKDALWDQNARVEHVENRDEHVVRHFGLPHPFVPASAKHRLH